MARDIALVLVVFALFIAGFVGAIVFVQQTTCTEFARVNSGLEFQYLFWNGCLVRLPNGVWLSTDRMNWVNGQLQILGQ
jgi:hypothetical protein